MAIRRNWCNWIFVNVWAANTRTVGKNGYTNSVIPSESFNHKHNIRKCFQLNDIDNNKKEREKKRWKSFVENEFRYGSKLAGIWMQITIDCVLIPEIFDCVLLYQHHWKHTNGFLMLSIKFASTYTSTSTHEKNKYHNRFFNGNLLNSPNKLIDYYAANIKICFHSNTDWTSIFSQITHEHK